MQVAGEEATRHAACVASLLAALFAAPMLGAQEAPPAVEFEVSAFSVEGDNPLTEADTEAVLADYLGKHSGLDGLVAAADAFEQRLRKQGYTFHRVLLPAQTLSGGVVKLQVVAFKIGKISVKGNQHFSRENVLASVPTLVAGTIPDPQVLSRELALANRHPSKQVAMSFKQSEEEEAVDANLKVDDKKPWTVFASLSNTGSDQTGNERLSVGGQYSNLFDLDHAITLSYTTSPGHWGDVRQYGANYRAPLYSLAGAVDAYYVSSDVNSGTIADFFDVSGSGEFAGVRYTQMLDKSGAYTHEVSLGFDNRAFDNVVLFGGTNLGGEVRSSPLSLRYAGSYEAQAWQGSFSVEYAHNVPFGENESGAAYALAAARPNARASWDVLRADGSIVYAFPSGWAVQGRVAGQLGREPLIPGEQFGVGGAASARGFEEREASGDDGVSMGAEVWTPPLPQDIRLLAFVDGGRIWIRNAQPGQVSADSLLSAGVGLRWQWRDNIGLQVDLARVINGTAISDSGTYKAHFNLFARF